MSGHINHIGNFQEKIKFCYNIHLCLLEETIQGSIDHAALFVPHRSKVTSGASWEIRVVTDGLLGSQRELSHLLRGDLKVEGTDKVPQSPLNCGLAVIEAWQLPLFSPFLTSPCT